MIVNELSIRNFKRIEAASVPLFQTTTLVGGNNSGKTTVLQAAHFGIGLLQTSVREANPAFPAEKLLYSPTADVFDVPHRSRLTATTPVEISYQIEMPGQQAERLSVSLIANSEGGIQVEHKGSDAAFKTLSDLENVFSIYVPGLAGIPAREEYRSDGVLRNAIARGDANLFLRNVLFRIFTDADKRKRLETLIETVFSGITLEVEFDQKHDQYIDARVKGGGIEVPLDMAGTGVLQFLQIAAYTVNYQPSLLLLDEPDAHLHPDNQRKIAKAFSAIATAGQSRVILATHSRTILESLKLDEESRFLWLEDGAIQGEKDKGRLAMLVGLGALDGAERFYAGNYRAVVLTEDEGNKRGMVHLKLLLTANGFNVDEVLIRSYVGASNLEGAGMLAQFVADVRPGVPVLVHRDRDFMTDAEAQRMTTAFAERGVDLYLTNGSDIEAAFASPLHISKATGLELTKAESLVDDLLLEHNLDIANRYVNKREIIKNTQYKGRPNECPSVSTLMSGSRVERRHAVGKDLLGWVMAAIEAKRIARSTDLMKATDGLVDSKLVELRKLVEEAEPNSPNGATNGGQNGR